MPTKRQKKTTRKKTPKVFLRKDRWGWRVIEQRHAQPGDTLYVAEPKLLGKVKLTFE